MLHQIPSKMPIFSCLCFGQNDETTQTGRFYVADIEVIQQRTESEKLRATFRKQPECDDSSKSILTSSDTHSLQISKFNHHRPTDVIISSADYDVGTDISTSSHRGVIAESDLQCITASSDLVDKEYQNYPDSDMPCHDAMVIVHDVVDDSEEKSETIVTASDSAKLTAISDYPEVTLVSKLPSAPPHPSDSPSSYKPHSTTTNDIDSTHVEPFSPSSASESTDVQPHKKKSKVSLLLSYLKVGSAVKKVRRMLS